MSTPRRRIPRQRKPELEPDICHDVGFDNGSNFNRRFLDIKGMTAREFRRDADSRVGGRH